jgi:hypothetical protein
LPCSTSFLEAAVSQRLFAKFPTQIDRENISTNREFSARPGNFLHHRGERGALSGQKSIWRRPLNGRLSADLDQAESDLKAPRGRCNVIESEATGSARAEGRHRLRMAPEFQTARLDRSFA